MARLVDRHLSPTHLPWHRPTSLRREDDQRPNGGTSGRNAAEQQPCSDIRPHRELDQLQECFNGLQLGDDLLGATRSRSCRLSERVCHQPVHPHIWGPPRPSHLFRDHPSRLQSWRGVRVNPDRNRCELLSWMTSRGFLEDNAMNPCAQQCLLSWHPV